MWPMQSARTFPSRLNSIASASSDYDRWSRFSDVDSSYEYDYDDQPPMSPTEDLGDLVRSSQQALNVLRNTSDADSCFNFDDCDGGSTWDDYGNEYASVGAMSRRPTRRHGSVASRFTARSNYGRRPSDDSNGRSPYGQIGGLLAPGGVQPPARMPSVRYARMNSTVSRRGTRRMGAGLDRNANLLRRVTTKRRAMAKPLPATAEAREDTDFEASLARLSASSIIQLDPHSSVHSLSLLVPGAAPHSVVSNSSSSTLRNSPPLPGQMTPPTMSQYYGPAAMQAPKKPEPAWMEQEKPQFPEWQESNVERSVTVRNVRLGTESSVASLISTAEKPLVPGPYGEKRDSVPYTPSSSPPPQEPPQDPTPMATGLKLAAITLALSLAVFVVGLDVNIISTAIPKITQEFNSLDDIAWYGSSFLMTTCAFQVLFGRIYTLFSAKWVFTAALAIFEIGSLVCALAPSSPLFILGRAVQGVGTSGILSGALIIGALIVPLEKRPLLGGVIGAMEGVAMISAPLIGGFFTDHLTWRWCFYINLPIGGVVVAVVLLILQVPKQTSDHVMVLKEIPWVAKILYLVEHLDLLGMVLLIPTIVSVLLALQWGGTKYPWDHLGIIALFLLAAVLLAIFCYFQHRKQDGAMIPPRILKQRTILAGFWYMLCTSSALVVMAYFLPLWFQSVLNLSPSASGVRMLPMLLGVIVAVLASGALVSAIGYYGPFMIAGTVLMSVGAGLLSSWTPTASSAQLILYPALFGAGVGIAFQQPIIAAQTVLAEQDIPIGTSVIVFGQSIGAAVVLAVAETVFSNRLAANIRDLLGLPVTTESLLAGGVKEVAAAVLAAGGSLAGLLEAQNKAVTQAFYVALAMAGLSAVGALAVEWKSVKKEGERRKAEAEAAAAAAAGGGEMAPGGSEMEKMPGV